MPMIMLEVKISQFISKLASIWLENMWSSPQLLFRQMMFT